MRSQLTNLRSQLINLRSQLTNLRSQLINLRSQLINLRSQLTNLRSQLTNLRSQLTNLRSQLTNLRSQLTNLRSQLTNLRSQLTNLRSQLTNLRSQLINLRSQLTNLRSQLINLRSQLNNWRSQLTNLQSFKVTKMAGRFVFVCFIVMTLPSSYYTLPNYLPTLRHGNQERNSLIEEYFHLGFNYSEMLSFLLLYHGVRLSLRQLKRILRSRGLRRRKIQSGINRVVNAIDQELQSSGSCIGYRQMHQRLLKDHGIVIDRETVRRIVKGLDPDGVELRSRKRFRRRRYVAAGPNFIWHLDGYDKLKPYGFCIHGAIDGYSRRILWLEVGPSNNDPMITVQYFIDCARQLRGCPRVVRGDCGTENIHIAAVQRFLRRNCQDDLAGTKSFMYGKSVANQRIEAWWGFLRKSNTDWWMRFFKDLTDMGHFDNCNVIHVECLRFCFMGLIREELHRVAQNWNLHRIRPSNGETPAGRPDILFFLPHELGSADYKVKNANDNDLDVAENLCGNRHHPFGCSPLFIRLAELVMEDNNLQLPRDAEEAMSLYLELLYHINNI